MLLSSSAAHRSLPAQRSASGHALRAPKFGHSKSCTCRQCRFVTVCSAASDAGKPVGAVTKVLEASDVAEGTLQLPPTDPRMAEQTYLQRRIREIRKSFPNALSVDDFLARVEMALCGFGFTNENTIAMTNLCRDEVTAVLKTKIDDIYGSSFNTNGLGGLLSCGVTGMKAGFSHSPVCDQNKERYVFFAFPHIAIDSDGTIGAISRPNRPGASCACGALAASLASFKTEGVDAHTKPPGVHDPDDTELSILKQRLARRIKADGMNPEDMNLVDITRCCERVITEDLQKLIAESVDTKKADYAVITGVEVHNWSTNYHDDTPNLEFIAPAAVYVVKDGNRFNIDLTQVPGLTPRQLRLVSASVDLPPPQQESSPGGGHTSDATIMEVPKETISERRRSFVELLQSMPK